MKKIISIFILFSIAFFISQTGCRNDKADPEFNGFPAAIGKIVYTRCAVSGCHTDADKEAAGGLSMSSWDKLFEGGHGSAAVIPYRSDYSPLCYFINTYSD